MTTLYALDPLSHTFCFGKGEAGLVFQHHEIRNRCSDVDFNSYNPGNFTVGIEGGRVGSIIDLGNSAELKQRYQYQESSLTTGQGFASIRVEKDSLVILKERGTAQPLTESTKLFTEGKTSATAPIRLGHIYLIRLTDKHDKSFQLLAKMIVVSYQPNDSVTIRWQLL